MPDDAIGSDVPPAPGYWKASDGNWYPPESAPAPVASPSYTAYAPGGPGPMVAPTNGLATAGMVLGIIGLCLFWTFGLGVFLGLLAVIFGAIGLGKTKSAQGTPHKGRAQAGVITGVLAMVAGVVFIALAVAAVDDSYDQIIRDAGVDSDPSDGYCNTSRYMQDPDC